MMSPPDSTSGENDASSTAAGHPDGQVDYSANKVPTQDMVDSLGYALAGVNIGSQSTSSFSYASSAPSTFSLASDSAPPRVDGWGNFTEGSTGQAFQITGGLVAATVPQEFHGGGMEAQRRNQDHLDFFLSQDPSHALGDDVFKLGQVQPTAFPFEEEKDPSPANDVSNAFRFSGQSLAPGPSSKSGYGEIRPAQEARRRTDSPSCSVTGTTSSSRSASPYGTNSDVGVSGRTIHAYHRYDSAPVAADASRQVPSLEEDRSGYMSSNHASHPSMSSLDPNHRTPYGKDRNLIKNMTSSSVHSFDHGLDRSMITQNQDVNPSQVPSMMPGQQQVLYMAVPSPDGRGQVLQPVQMLQLPGKPYTYVVPGAGGLNSGPLPDGPGMMVLPPLPSPPADLDGSYSIAGNGVVGGDLRSPMDNRSRGDNFGSDGSPSYLNDPSARDDYGRSGNGSNQYQPDAAVATLYSAPQRPPLDALLGQVRRLSRDQVGCRLVQQALDEEGPMAATLILNEGLPFWGEAMVDPFGNYLFQKILEKINIEERVMLVRSVSSRLVNASLNLHGTRSVQKIVELCALDDKNVGADSNQETASDILTKSLAPAAARLCIDSHGNHVIQRILLKLGPKHAKFVFDAVAASVSDVARHRHGCCVIQRCLDSPPTEARSHLVHRIVEKALELMQDAYGNYVVQYVLDVCSDPDVHAVCESVVGKVNLLAIQKFSSNVMEKCLERCSDRVRELYLQEMSDPERIRELMMDPFGNYVVQRALSVATHAQAIRLVEAMRPHLIATQTGGPNGQRNGGVRNTAGGRRIIAKICRRFPNFTLTPSGSHEEMYSQSKGTQRQQHPQPSLQLHQGQMVPAYAPLGTPPLMQQLYGSDPRIAPGHIQVAQPQQHSFYSFDGNAYYDPYIQGNGGFTGL